MHYELFVKTFVHRFTEIVNETHCLGKQLAVLKQHNFTQLYI